MYQNILTKLKALSFFDTFKHASTYFSGTLLIHGLGLVTLPVFTAYLTEAEYGIVNVFSSYISFLAVILSFNLHWAISRYFYEEDKKDFDSFLGTIFITVSILFWAIAAIVMYYKNGIASYVNMPAITVFWGIVMSYMVVLHSFFEQIMIATKQSKKYTIVQVLLQYIKFLCTVIGLIYWTDVTYKNATAVESYTYMGKIIGDFVGIAIIWTYAFYQVTKYMSFKKLSWGHVSYAAAYSIPLIPFALSEYILTSFDQWFIHSTIGQIESGLYSFAYKISLVYLGLTVALAGGSQASYYQYMNEKNHHEVWKQVDSMSKLLILGGGFLILFAIDIGTLLSSNDAFLDALSIAPVLIAAYMFHGISAFYNRGINYVKKNTYLALIILTSGVVNILLNWYFIQKYGYHAAAYTTLASYIIMLLLSIVVTTFILKLPALPLGRIIKYIVILSGVVGINYLIGEPNVGLNIGWIAFKILLFGILGLIFFFNKIGLLWGVVKK